MTFAPRKPTVHPVKPFVHKNNIRLRNLLKDRILPFAEELHDKATKRDVLAKDREDAKKLDSLAEKAGLSRLNGRGYLETLFLWIGGLVKLQEKVLQEKQEDTKNKLVHFDMSSWDSMGRRKIAEIVEFIREETGLSIGTIHSDGEVVGVCKVSYIGVEGNAYIVDLYDKSGMSVASSNPKSVVFYRSTLPDFLRENDEGQPDAYLGDSAGYLSSYPSETIDSLESYGIDQHLFFQYLIHEMRHRIDYKHDLAARMQKILPKNGLDIEIFKEATAYLSMVVDGPNSDYVLMRMFTLLRDRPDGYTHKVGALLGLAYMAKGVPGIPDWDKESYSNNMVILSMLGKEELRERAYNAMLRLYQDIYGMDKSDHF